MSIPYSIKRISMFSGPRKIFFGLNSLKVLTQELDALDAKSLLTVTDENMVKLGYVDKVEGKIDGVKMEVFDKVEREPSLSGLEELASRVRSRDYDAILGLGGGSAMDSAKIASISATNSGPISDFIGANKVQKKGLPLVCVPTTSGTGSEVTKFAVIRYERTKKAVVSDFIVPDIAVVDPVLTVSMPPKLTVHTGLDALSHVVEAMISKWATPFTDALALGTIGWIFQYLRRAYVNGGDIEARYYMSLAATMAGLSFNGPRVLLAHSIGQTIGPVYNIPHGLSVAFALPYMLDFYLDASSDKIAMISERAGVYDPRKTGEENAHAMIAWLFQFYKELDMPLSLKDFGIPFNALERLAEDTVTFQPRRNSPVRLTKKNLVRLYGKMWEGEV